jgi:hypothetical protein
VPIATTGPRGQASAPAAPPTLAGRMAVAAAPAAAEPVSRKRELASALVTTNACVLDIKAIPVERQTLATESTKQLLAQCAQAVPKAQWPADIEWAKKLLDEQQEKSLLKSTDKPQ